MTHLLGLDIGTTGCKASLFDTRGKLVAKASREYSVDFPVPGWAEQDGEKVWTLAQQAMQEVIQVAGRPEVAAIGLSVQGEAVMPVDQNGRALRPAILGMDTRTGIENDWLRERFGARHLFERTGMPIHTINTLPKLLWLKQHEPETWRRAHRFLLYEDFLIQKMTGQAAISRCLASRTQLYNLVLDGWSTEILEALELEATRLADVKPSGYVAGKMLPELAERLGLRPAPLVVTGGHDQACGALGVGLTAPGLAMVSTGTAEVVEVAMSAPALNETLYQGNISIYAHTAPELYVCMTLNHSGGLLLRWFRDTFCQAEMQQAAQQGVDAYDLLLQTASIEPGSILVLPHFAGSGTPTFDTQSKGAFLGLTFAATKTDLAKAILEGLTFELRTNLDLLRAGGVAIDELRAIGGGARSDLWLQLKADITGIRVLKPRVTEAASWGAAILAGVGAGVFASPSQAVDATLHFEQVFEPDPTRQAAYQAQFERYQQLYPATVPIHHHM
jgi:xylulokinase